MAKNKAVFFDRDGVLNHDLGYIYKIQDFFWMEGAKEAIALCKSKDYKVFVVTNQSGIARGLYKEEDVQKLHNFMLEELQKSGTSIDDFAYCPHHPEGKVEEYTRKCECRKPSAGMILTLAQKHNIDLSQSFMLGDHPRDVEAAQNAGMQGYLFKEVDTLAFIEKIFEQRKED